MNRDTKIDEVKDAMGSGAPSFTFASNEVVDEWYDIVTIPNELYHGGPVAVPIPDLRIVGYDKDFGRGFYCTKLKPQAMKWSKQRTKTGFVSVYQYTPNLGCNVKYFILNDEWLDFVANCRHGGTHVYDITVGPMADDKIFNFVGPYLRGMYNREQFWVLARFKHPTHQIAFHTQKALSTLRCLGSEVVL